MSSSPSSRLTATHIPNITQLRTELDYGDASLSRCKSFYDDIRVYRRKFKTENGRRGDELHEWKGAEAQAALDEITEAYLYRDGNGDLFWPNDETYPNSNALQYSKHRKTISRLVKQLIFRLNQQQFRNNKYKKKDQTGDNHMTSRGASIDNPIEVDDANMDDRRPFPLPAQAPSPQNTHTGQSTTSGQTHIVKLSLPGDKIASLGMRASSAHGSRQDAASARSQNSSETKRRFPIPQRTGLDNDKIFDIPSSPEPSGQARKRPSTAHQSGRNPTGTTKRQKKPAPIIKDSRVEKQDAPRTSPRSKKTVQSSHRGSINEVEDGTGSPSRPRRSDTEVEKEVDAWMHRFSDDIAAEILDEDLAQLESARRQGIQDGVELSSDLPQDSRARLPLTQPLQPTTPIPDMAKRGATSTGPPQSPLHSSPIAIQAHTGDSVLPSVENRIENVPQTKDASERGTPARGAARPKAAIEIGYLLILSRSPIYESRSWNPEGSFQELSLAQLLDQLPFGGDVKGLHFTFEGPGLRIKEWIDRENESGFARLKMHLNKGLRAVLANNPPSTKLLVYELEIEPQREGAAIEDDEDDLTSFF